MAKKTVFLTGSSGNMGWYGFQELYKRRERFNLVLLNRDNKHARSMFAPYENDPAVKLVWGDFTNYNDVLDCVTGADIVLHVGGMVSPAADYDPKGTIHTNVTAAHNIVKAVKAQPNPDAIKVVYIGTVAQTGERDTPIHWARTGDPIKISVYDHYAISKVIAESIFAESGLRRWVSLRQSGILHTNIIKRVDPIMFHLPINGVLEWATVEDSGRLLANICEDWVPANFWRRFYNISSGADYRITNFEFKQHLLKTLGLGDPRKLFNANWFALRNFHGQWYADSDVLERYLKFRENKPIKQYFADIAMNLPWFYKFAKLAPKSFVKVFMMKKLAKTPRYGTLHWIKTNDLQRIAAYFGSQTAWKAIGSWKQFRIKHPSKKVATLNHGWDEDKGIANLTLADLQQAAAFRGGEVASECYNGDPYQPVRWRCAYGHEFHMSPNLVLLGGHWCPKELPGPTGGDWLRGFIPWRYDAEARVNPFFAQVWYPLHGKDEDNVYGLEIYPELTE